MAEELSRTPVPSKDQWEAVGWDPGGTTYEYEMRAREPTSTVATALKDIADAQGDVEGFIAQYDPKTRKVPQIAAKIAQRLLAAEKAGEALAAPLVLRAMADFTLTRSRAKRQPAELMLGVAG